jgi:hypothetical protein
MGDRTDSQRLDDLEAELAKLVADNRQLRKRVRRAAAIGAAAFALPFAVFALAHVVAIPIGNARASKLYANAIELDDTSRSRFTVLTPGVVEVFGNSADVMLLADGEMGSVTVESTGGKSGETSQMNLLANSDSVQLVLESADASHNNTSATTAVNAGDASRGGSISETHAAYFGDQHAKYSVTTSASDSSNVELEARGQGWKLGTVGGLVDSRTGKAISN